MRRPVLYLAGLLMATGASLALAGPASAAVSHDSVKSHVNHDWYCDDDDDDDYDIHYYHHHRRFHHHRHGHGNYGGGNYNSGSFYGVNILSGAGNSLL